MCGLYGGSGTSAYDDTITPYLSLSWREAFLSLHLLQLLILQLLDPYGSFLDPEDPTANSGIFCAPEIVQKVAVNIASQDCQKSFAHQYYLRS